MPLMDKRPFSYRERMSTYHHACSGWVVQTYIESPGFLTICQDYGNVLTIYRSRGTQRATEGARWVLFDDFPIPKSDV